MKAAKIIFGITLAALTLLAPGCSGPIKEDAADKKVAITIDMSFGEDDYTEEILSVLDKQNVKASFFIVGILAEKKPLLVKRLISCGMEIENHSYYHKNYTHITDEELLADANKANELITSQTTTSNKFIRPPFNVVDERVKTALTNAGYTIILGLDSKDWERKGYDSIVSNVINSVQPGDILMFQSNVMDTPAAIDKIIKTLEERDYKIIPLSELLAKQE